MKTLTMWMACCYMIPSAWTLPTNRNVDKDDRANIPNSAPLLSNNGEQPKIYGTEPYQLQFQEPQLTSAHAHHNNYYPSSTMGSQKSSNNGLEPPRHHSYRHHVHQPQQQYNRQRTTLDQQDYDPFYFSARNGIVPSGVRTRRNSKFRDIWSADDGSNHLLNEDVHFFRREASPSTMTGRGDASVEFFHKDNHHRLPVLYGDEYPVTLTPYFPSSRTATYDRDLREGEGRQEPFSSSSLTSFDRRGDYPHQHPNHLDFYDVPRPRHHPHIPKLFVPEPYTRAREPIDGWSVQVGTRLRVHDDGRERNPGRFYVRDEKPADTRRYPHRHDYFRP